MPNQPAHLRSTPSDLPLSEVAYQTLRGKILRCEFEPGEKLKITDLAHALQVSPGAIREALNRLVPEQLVVSRDNKGCIVAPLSIDDLEDLTEFRCEIEAIGLRRSVVRGDIAWEGRVLAEAHHLSKTPNRSPPTTSITRSKFPTNPAWPGRSQGRRGFFSTWWLSLFGGADQRASVPVSPVRMRTTCSRS